MSYLGNDYHIKQRIVDQQRAQRQQQEADRQRLQQQQYIQNQMKADQQRRQTSTPSKGYPPLGTIRSNATPHVSLISLLARSSINRIRVCFCGINMEHKLVGYISPGNYNKLQFKPTDEKSLAFIQRTLNKPYKVAYISLPPKLTGELLPDRISKRIGIRCIITVAVRHYDYVIPDKQTKQQPPANPTFNQQKRLKGTYLQLTNIEDYVT